jgi:hypothetical protein
MLSAVMSSAVALAVAITPVEPRRPGQDSFLTQSGQTDSRKEEGTSVDARGLDTSAVATIREYVTRTRDGSRTSTGSRKENGKAALCVTGSCTSTTSGHGTRLPREAGSHSLLITTPLQDK